MAAGERATGRCRHDDGEGDDNTGDDDDDDDDADDDDDEDEGSKGGRAEAFPAWGANRLLAARASTPTGIPNSAAAAAGAEAGTDPSLAPPDDAPLARSTCGCSPCGCGCACAANAAGDGANAESAGGRDADDGGNESGDIGPAMAALMIHPFPSARGGVSKPPPDPREAEDEDTMMHTLEYGGKAKGTNSLEAARSLPPPPAPPTPLRQLTPLALLPGGGRAMAAAAALASKLARGAASDRADADRADPTGGEGGAMKPPAARASRGGSPPSPTPLKLPATATAAGAPELFSQFSLRRTTVSVVAPSCTAPRSAHRRLGDDRPRSAAEEAGRAAEAGERRPPKQPPGPAGATTETSGRGFLRADEVPGRAATTKAAAATPEGGGEGWARRRLRGS